MPQRDVAAGWNAALRAEKMRRVKLSSPRVAETVEAARSAKTAKARAETRGLCVGPHVVGRQDVDRAGLASNRFKDFWRSDAFPFNVRGRRCNSTPMASYAAAPV